MSDRIEKNTQIRASVARVWHALTDHHQFGQWFRVDMHGPFVVGKMTRGMFTIAGFEHVAFEVTVQAIEPERYFALRWHPYAVEPGVDYSAEPTTLIEFTLQAKDGGTLLQVVESGFDAIPIARRAEALSMNTSGWVAQLDNIRRHVESGDVV